VVLTRALVRLPDGYLVVLTRALVRLPHWPGLTGTSFQTSFQELPVETLRVTLSTSFDQSTPPMKAV